ncbi:ABC transporter, ATP-binding protein [Aurantimonas manganoxydans SI85-9A1]|uniref:ABC transporter, ATP-binding protein n=1 Tax=Aurantimonas manganoxydans (strain ATCC BAA-1229 / DSM 21871 / SI85-9A1) TaxID=287752 RepID=Q1YL76_AURMS|nr:ABC transporter ATP-binding protein [Aurantimonas manganoxydans]EAS51855.1 ABC transporter, ATP-binding protein [Aurantimonas manganoxydans SI85-9A1]
MNDHAHPAAASSGDVLVVENLVVTTRGRQPAPILDGISLRVGAGETVCLVGESGSGKSVTSLATMGLLPKGALTARSGRILVEGEDVLTASPARLRQLRATRMSMIFQEPMTALNPVMTVESQLEEVLSAHASMSTADRRTRIRDILSLVHLPDVERMCRSYPHQLSGGQRQRVMIAMALVLEPRLLIADEPTTALDVTTQKQILKLIREIQERLGTSVLFITHDMGVVADIADRVYVMRAGEIVESGPIEAILTAPTKPYTRNLLTAVPALRPRDARPAASREIVLETSELGMTYSQGSLFRKREGTVAAKDVNLILGRGRTLGIVGESGSGKSTVARCVMRLIEPTAGTIRLRGSDISGLSRRALRPWRKRIQMIFQDPNRSLNPRLTVGDSITEGPINYGTSPREAREQAKTLLELVGLPKDAIDRHPHQFSGGQRQRIAIARALAMEPDVLVADEAVSALDVSVQAQVLDLLDDIQARLGVALLFITHDLRVAAQICDEVVVMQRGRVVEYGPTAEVLGNPREAYTRELIDAAPGRYWDFPNFCPLPGAAGFRDTTVPA